MHFEFPGYAGFVCNKAHAIPDLLRGEIKDTLRNKRALLMCSIHSNIDAWDIFKGVYISYSYFFYLWKNLY